jgi:RES domain-containing protein
MMRTVYKISRSIHAHDLAGSGAAKYGGRWNPKGVHVLYTASSAALAMLEWLIHANECAKSAAYSYATISIPDNSIQKLSLEALPADWKNEPPPHMLAEIGRRFVTAGKYLALEVPSVLVPYDSIIMLNTKHPLMQEVKLLSVEEVFPNITLISKPVQ